MALAPAHLSAWQARSLGLVSTSGRHASPLTPLQPATTRAATGGGSSSGSRRGLLSPGTAVGYGSRAAVSAAAGQPVVSSRPYSMPPGSLIGRPPSAPPTQLQQLQRAATAAPAPPAHTQVQAGQAGQHAQQQQQQAGSDDDVAPPAASRIHLPSERELERRKKISKANKGRRPWNVGKKHSPDTIARIKAATRQAMQRPEVRQRLAEANERREPHTDAAKAKIRVKLLERAGVAREVINEQAARIVKERLLGSDDPALRELGEYPKVQEVVAGLAWQHFKKDWSQVCTRGWDDHPEFQSHVIAKLTRLVRVWKAKNPPQEAKPTAKPKKVNKVKVAMVHLRKVHEAQGKLAAAEEAMTKLQRAKATLASDPVRLRQALAAEEKASLMISKLRQQVAHLEEALQPVQHYFEEAGQQQVPDLDQQLDLERRLEAQQQEQQQRLLMQQQGAGDIAGTAAGEQVNGMAAAPHTNGIVNGWAGAHVAAAEALQQQHEAPPAVNGHAGSMPPPGAARTQMPWDH
ncbi:hypothetical protein CHLNCDRAFT_142114 [Chlorella variabilis]|uniref:Nuclease associated modular domain-containing protein n=1 Tax=Chlorella variabilis TaxID=554065 RepID=E1Z7T4_CHLVA|nr:hypothetical protein CHLNCDRAFT_142114 [Chlorella variabilis]EFN57973.1 hypothetical protein CHLNCDRAFT_142114 [Chlorella variabilis]|eukprot:XP_005850075.1 hypothetical protein CHLNCDRAFT_142114 [Chlorella variabilis]